MIERCTDKHTSTNVEFQYGVTHGIKLMHIKKKHVDPIPIRNPRSGDLSLVHLASFINLDRLFIYVMKMHEQNTASPLSCVSYPIPPRGGGVITQYGRASSSDPIMTYRKNCNIETTVRILSLDKPSHSRAIVVLSTHRSSDLVSSVL